MLYNHQNLLRSGSSARDSLKAWAVQIGLDQARFDACLDTGRYADWVRTETQEAKRLGVQGTPAIFVDDQVVTGATGVPTPEEIEAAIDQALARKGQ